MKADLTNWYTEADAADAIECSVRNVQRYIAAGKIEVRKRPRDGKKPENVLSPRDVDALRPAAHVMPAAEEEHDNHADDSAVVANGANGANGPRKHVDLVAMIAAVMMQQQRQLAAPAPRPWITLEEAAEASGLTRTFIRDRAAVGAIASCRGGEHGRILVNRASLLEFRG